MKGCYARSKNEPLGVRRNLDALRAAGWYLLISAKGVVRDEGMPYALDNRAWSSCQTSSLGGRASLDFALRWLDYLRAFPGELLIAVQDGVAIDDVRAFLPPVVGIFVSGVQCLERNNRRSEGCACTPAQRPPTCGQSQLRSPHSDLCGRRHR